ncbi:MAG: hypothetical protein GAK35_03392 [Herbaspirillum frisingense]|uniref:DUF2635 domain-containing protein n=1 Tax=Herbaspirillum frisingense TaxID=92645 RepID=A0A7V8FUA7_9BURK|nr:MAG: hypothetical protein GAK35_03392 [Herbaspirillum frisingense]
MYIKPADGLIVRDPVTKQAIPAEGVEVGEFDLYWAARLRDGDVVRAEAPTQEQTAATASGQADESADAAAAQAKGKAK